MFLHPTFENKCVTIFECSSVNANTASADTTRKVNRAWPTGNDSDGRDVSARRTEGLIVKALRRPRRASGLPDRPSGVKSQSDSYTARTELGFRVQKFRQGRSPMRIGSCTPGTKTPRCELAQGDEAVRVELQLLGDHRTLTGRVLRARHLLFVQRAPRDVLYVAATLSRFTRDNTFEGSRVEGARRPVERNAGRRADRAPFGASVGSTAGTARRTGGRPGMARPSRCCSTARALS